MELTQIERGIIVHRVDLGGNITYHGVESAPMVHSSYHADKQVIVLSAMWAK